MKRIEAIKTIINYFVVKNTILITSTGMISREVYAVKDRPLNFYMMGSMGDALAIGIGVAINRPDLKVVVINGDGSALMSLGTIVTMNKLKPKNLWHYILDNNEHSSTGGQKTVSDNIKFINLCNNTVVVKVNKGKGNSPRIPLTCKQIKERFMKAIKEIE